MSNVIDPVKTAPPAGASDHIVAQYHCEGCESPIPPEQIVAVVDKVTGLRRVKTYCDHCRRGYQRDFALSYGQWVPVDVTIPVTGNRLRRLVRKLEPAMGIIRQYAGRHAC